jgi:hypothetical protein
MMMFCAVVAWSLNTLRNLILRVVDAPGLATTSVVVAAAMLVSVRPGVTVVPDKSVNVA